MSISTMKSCLIFSTLLLSLHLCHCINLPQDQTLIDQTCKKTPFPDLCKSSLQSDPRSQSANLQGLGLIMVDVINAKATATQKRIKELLNGNPSEPNLKHALNSCADKYNAIIVGDVEQARQAVATGNYKFAVDAANDAAAEADNCEKGFGGKSPVSDMNRDVHGVSLVASSIVTMLMAIN